MVRGRLQVRFGVRFSVRFRVRVINMIELLPPRLSCGVKPRTPYQHDVFVHACAEALSTPGHAP